MGVSFVSIFIVSYHIVFWVCGAAHSLSWDYLPGVPQGEEAEKRLPWDHKPLGSLFCRYVLRRGVDSSCINHEHVDSTAESPAIFVDETKEHYRPQLESDRYAVQRPNFPGSQGQHLEQEVLEHDLDVELGRKVSRKSVISQLSRHQSIVPSVETTQAPTALLPEAPLVESVPATTLEKQGHVQRFVPSIMTRVLKPLAVIITPVTVAIAISLPIALIESLKALFVDVSASGGPNWKGPDGKPPLAFVIDTGTPS